MAMHEMGEDYIIIEDGPIATESVYEDYETERNKPMPNRIHGVVQLKLGSILTAQYDDHFQFGSEISLATTPPSTPDLCIYPKKKLRVGEVEAKETEMPITTIEIMSPSQSLADMQQKIRTTYFPMGVRSAWIVVPELKVIQVLRPNDEQYVYQDSLTDPTTGIQISVEKVFEDLA